VFTARYELSPYIKQITFRLQRVNYYRSSNKINASLRNYHGLVRTVTEHDGECEHRAF
jgi:hypothetical protein